MQQANKGYKNTLYNARRARKITRERDDKRMKRVYMKDRNFKFGDVQDFKSNERQKFTTKRFAKFCHETKCQKNSPIIRADN